MPPATTPNTVSKKARMHAKFSAAATALADLYRESSNAYEAGYRDALLFVQRYLQTSSSSSGITQAITSTPAAASAAPTASFASPSFPRTVSAPQMARFLQDTITARRERVAVVRGVRAMRRRQREDGGEEGRSGSSSGGDEDDGGLPGSSDDGSDVEEADAVAGEEEEEDEGDETGLTPQPSPAVGSGPLVDPLPPLSEVTLRPALGALSVAVAQRDSAAQALNREMEHITHLDPRALSTQPPLLHPPRRQRRTDRVQRVHARPLPSPSSGGGGHPFSTQLRVGRQA